MNRRVKVAAVGDTGVGKSRLLLLQVKEEITANYVPTVFENYVVKVQVNNKDVALG
jgi:GTPase SAR1 family protein